MTGVPRAIAAASALLTLAALTACVHEMSASRIAPGTSPLPSAPWTPPAPPAEETAPPAAATPEIPADLLATAAGWTLTDLLDLALRTAPQTRITWARARSAAAALGADKGDYYPSVVGQVNGSRTRGTAVGGQFTFIRTSYDPFLEINWLLLDFGGRKATVESAREALVAADWSHNAAIQDIVLQVEEAYYGYLDAHALEKAERAAVDEAQASLDAAERRRAGGVSTIADVLQAKTGLSQAQLVLQTIEGRIQTIHGSLAAAIGLPADTPFDVTIPEAEVPEDEAAVQVDRAIKEAEARRPELAAARASVAKAAADLRARQSIAWPTLNFSTNAGRIYYDSFAAGQDTYTASILLTIPIFNGLSYQYNVQKAKADRDEAQAQLDTLHQQVTLDVWTSYYDHQTARQQVRTSRDLLESAQQSYEVVSARYKAGVGSILDLLTAQSALERARALETQARTAWFVSLSRLAHATGSLWQPPAGAAPATSDPAPPVPGATPALNEDPAQ
jgi:outer membrane protein TolC